MIDRIINMVIRQVTRQLVSKGVNKAMRAGGQAISKGMEKRRSKSSEEIDQDPAVTQRRRLHPDERKGDDILYPTDEYTEDMQPRR